MRVKVDLVRKDEEIVEERTIEVEQIPTRGEILWFLMPGPTGFLVTSVKRSFSDPGEVLGVCTELERRVNAEEL